MIVALLIIFAWFAFICLPMPEIVSYGVSTNNLECAYMYIFMHASWLHLIINTITLIAMWLPVRKLYINRYDEDNTPLDINMLVASVIAGAACASSVPTVGMSGCVFFLCGALIMLNPTKQQLLNYLWLVAAVLIQWFFGKSNVPLHILSFVEGMVFISARELIYQYENNTGLFEPKDNADA